MKLKTTKTYDFLINHWPVSGVVDCTFDNNNFKMYNECDDGLTNIFYYQSHFSEENDLRLFIALAKHSTNIVDIGANTGIYSILASLNNKCANIYAIEPYSSNFKRLNINAKLNNCNNILTERIAFGDYEGTIDFTVPENNNVTDVSSSNEEFTKVFYPKTKWKNETVNIGTIDNFKIEKKIETINLIKCDVESSEMNVFRGMDYILANDQPTIIFECFLDEERKIFFNDVLKKYTYFVYLISQDGIIHLSQNFDGNNVGRNYLISPITPAKSFFSYSEIIKNPGCILLR